MTKEREDFLHWKSQQTGGELIKEMFVLVDELRGICKQNRCIYVRNGYRCRTEAGHAGEHDFTERKPNRC